MNQNGVPRIMRECRKRFLKSESRFREPVKFGGFVSKQFENLGRTSVTCLVNK